MKSKLKEVEHEIDKHFGKEVLQQVKVGLAVIATLLLKIYQPITLVFTGASGSSKTLSCTFLSPNEEHDELKNHIVRVDNFTPASFVSHASNRKKEALEKIDLLPKIKDRCLITKELAPLFRGKTDDLQKTFSILISILDGKGYMSSSGVQGIRGYDEEIGFSWLGATTPLTNRVHNIMAQLGTRLVFYNTDAPEMSEEALMEYAEKKDTSAIEADCRKLCNDFLEEFFKEHEVRSISESELTFPTPLLRRLVRYVVLMCYLRAGFSTRQDAYGNVYFSKPVREKPLRAINIFKSIAYGSALIHGRKKINADDLLQIKHIAYSSMPERRRVVFQTLIKNKGVITSDELEKKAHMSRVTAIDYMEELGHLEVVDFEKGKGQKPAVVRLKKQFKWLVPERLRRVA